MSRILALRNIFLVQDQEVRAGHLHRMEFDLPLDALSMKPIYRLLISATTAVSIAAFAAEPATVPQPDLQKGGASFAAVCVACHGADGNAPAPTFPKLAQQHPAYIVKQLQEFKSGKRANDVMKGMSATLSDDDARNVAAWLATQKAAPNVAKDKVLIAMGEKIYRGGIADRAIPACAGCHSPNGAGIPAQYPRLSGQYAEYVASQLTAFRDGVRLNSPQMTAVAAKMNDKEIKAVADYIAGLR